MLVDVVREPTQKRQFGFLAGSFRNEQDANRHVRDPPLFVELPQRCPLIRVGDELSQLSQNAAF